MDRRNRQKQGDIYAPEQVKRVIAGAGVDIEGEVDSDYIIFCPYHNNYRTPAAEISKTSGLFFCFSCQERHNLIEFVMKVTEKTYFQAVRFVDQFASKIDIVTQIDDLLVSEPEFTPFDELMIKRLHQSAMDSPRAVRYIEGRRINVDSMRTFQLGYSEKRDMVTIPVHSPDGRMYVGFVGRSIEGKEFKNTYGNWRSKTLFNLHRARRHSTVYVVEASFDAIRLHQNNVPAVGTNGSYVSKSQVDLLTKHFNRVIVIGDNDNAGQGMNEKLFDRMGERATLVTLPPRFKDIGDLTDDDIVKLTSWVDNPVSLIN